MTDAKNNLLRKYLYLIDKSTFNHDEDGVITEVVSAVYVRALLKEMMREYECMNSRPREDFWGQPI